MQNYRFTKTHFSVVSPPPLKLTIVLATHVYGDKLEVYPTNEFGIFLKDAPNYPKDGVHDGFNDISPPQEMTLMGSTSPDYVD